LCGSILSPLLATGITHIGSPASHHAYALESAERKGVFAVDRVAGRNGIDSHRLAAARARNDHLALRPGLTCPRVPGHEVIGRIAASTSHVNERAAATRQLTGTHCLLRP
jgi:hypothetical protein